MKEFMMIFRNDHTPGIKPSPEQMQGMMKQWQDWMGSIAAQNKLASSGSRLASENSKVVKPNNVVTNGPYAEIKEAIGGYIIVKETTIDAAVELAKDCPIFNVGGNVEVREVIAMEN